MLALETHKTYYNWSLSSQDNMLTLLNIELASIKMNSNYKKYTGILINKDKL